MVTSCLIIEGDRIIVRNVGRPVVTTRDEVVDFGSHPWGGPGLHPDEPAVSVLRTDGREVSAIGVVDTVFQMRRGDRATTRVTRELVAWYLRVPADDPAVDRSLARTGPLSGRYVYRRRRHGRVGGWTMVAILWLASPLLLFTFGLMSDPAARTDWSVLLYCVGMWVFFPWLALAVLRPTVLIAPDRIEITNPITRRRVIGRDDVEGIDVGDELVVRTVDGDGVAIYQSRRHWRNTTRGWRAKRQQLERDLDEWLNPPGAAPSSGRHRERRARPSR
jgi:hypothetical protein